MWKSRCSDFRGIGCRIYRGIFCALLRDPPKQSILYIWRISWYPEIPSIASLPASRLQVSGRDVALPGIASLPASILNRQILHPMPFYLIFSDFVGFSGISEIRFEKIRESEIPDFQSSGFQRLSCSAFHQQENMLVKWLSMEASCVIC